MHLRVEIFALTDEDTDVFQKEVVPELGHPHDMVIENQHHDEVVNT